MVTLSLIASLVISAQVAAGGQYSPANGNWLADAYPGAAAAASPPQATPQDRSNAAASAMPPSAGPPVAQASTSYPGAGGGRPPASPASPITPIAGGGSPFAPAGIAAPAASASGIVPFVSQPPSSVYAPAAPGANTLSQATPAADAGQTPPAMMRKLLTPPAGSRLAGQPVALEEVVLGAASRTEQTARVEAYWNLSAAVAQYYAALREQGERERWRQSDGDGRTELAVRLDAAERAARAAQRRVASIAGRGADAMPLPADAPLCGSYETRYEQVFVGRIVPEASELHQLISLRYAELEQSSTALARTWEQFDAATSAAGGAAAADARQLHELLLLQRRQFIQIACDYNHRIARYAELAAPPTVDATRYIGMLIKRSGPPAGRTGAVPLDRRSQNGGSASPTFAGDDGWVAAGEAASASARRDAAVTPASADQPAEMPAERSLLVPRR